MKQTTQRDDMLSDVIEWVLTAVLVAVAMGGMWVIAELVR
jgi:hypothetical protein